MTLDLREVRLLEELNFNAWPALKSVHLDGWLLRRTGGDSRRVNSVNPLAAGTIILEQKIAMAEAIYARWGRRAIYRLTPLADPGLDDVLAARGLTVDGATFVQTATIAEHPIPDNVRIFDHPPQAWIDAALTLRGLTGDAATVFVAQHQAVGIESGWAMISVDGAPAAVGVVAIERSWAGLHGIHVAKAARRRGLARRLSAALLSYAHANGARRAWLQVEQANAAALPLYTGLGFKRLYAYHHRVHANEATPTSGGARRG